MTFLIENWYLFALAGLSGGLLLWPTLTKGGGLGLTPNAAVLLMNREKAVVVDVCSAEEFAAGHVAGAKNLPLDTLEAKLPSTVKNKELPLILVCAVGMRSQRAVLVAQKLGYAKVYSLAGGLKAWREASLPISKD